MSSTEEQLLVVANPDENKLVCALPGSGKTHTTVNLADAILSDPDASVLMVTFTNAAAEEMQRRAIKVVGPKRARRLKARTFAKIMLEQHRPLAQGRRLILGGELDNYIYRVAKQLKVSYDNIPLFKDDIERIGRELYWKPGNDLKSRFFVELQNMLAMYQRVDLNTVSREVVLALHSGKITPLPYSFIIIDEFQDTDSIQYEWALAHQSPDRRFCVVGDDDQSIYSWRGAVGYQNMVNFQEDFNATGYLLSKCFRCAPMILGLAQRLIENGGERIHKHMTSARDIKGKVSCRVFTSSYRSPFTSILESTPEALRKDTGVSYMADDEIEGYRYIVDCIEEDYDQWAVLCRTNKHLDRLEYALSERGIPAARLGGKSIFDSPHAVGIAKLLVGLVFPKAKTQLMDGLGWAGEDEERLRTMFCSIHETGFAGLTLNTSWLSITQECHSLISQWSIDLRQEDKGTDLISQLLMILNKHHEQTNMADKHIRAAVVRSIFNMLHGMKGSLPDRVKKIYDLVTKGIKEKPSHRHPGKVVLCTLTGSKGLEWPKVFIMMINRQVIPSTQAEESGSQEHIDEERRLLYVGITRAEDELILHWHDGRPSMYIEELALV